MKYIITTILFFVMVFLIRIVIPMKRFLWKTRRVIHVHSMIQDIIATAAEYGEHVTIAEIEIQYNSFHKTCANLPEAYVELGKICADALSYYQSLSNVIRSKNIFVKEVCALVAIQNLVQAEVKTGET